jgi:hypothetical protein
MFSRVFCRATFTLFFLTALSGAVFGKDTVLRCVLFSPGHLSNWTDRSVAGILTQRGLALFRPFEIFLDMETRRGTAVQGTYGFAEFNNDRLFLSGSREGFRAKDGFTIDRSTGVVTWIVGEPTDFITFAYGTCDTVERRRF